MANEEQLAILRQGVEAWNHWRELNLEAEIDLSGANLSGVDLTDSNLEDSNLEEVNFEDATLTGARILGARLIKCNLSNTYLEKACFNYSNLTASNLDESTIIFAKLQKVCLNKASLNKTWLHSTDLYHASLEDASLEGAVLESASLEGASLKGASLKGALLNLTQCIGTSFDSCNLSGICIKDWQINEETSFHNVQCDYIYRGYNGETRTYIDRLPVNPEETFKPGEFEHWIKIQAEARKTIDLTFTDGIDWQAFFQSLQGVREQYPDSGVGLQAIEKKGSAFVIRLETSPGADQGAIEAKTKELYDTQLKLSKAEGKIEVLQDMNQTLERLAGRPTTENNIDINATGGIVTGQVHGEMEATLNNDSQANPPSNLWMTFLGWFQNGQAVIAIIALIIGVGSTYFIPKMFPNGFPPVNAEEDMKQLPTPQNESQAED